MPAGRMARPDASIQKAHPCDPWVLMVVHLLGTVRHRWGGGQFWLGTDQHEKEKSRDADRTSSEGLCVP